MFIDSAYSNNEEDGTEEQKRNQKNQVEISVDALFPIAEIHMISGVAGAEQHCAYVICEIKDHGADRYADAGFQKTVPRECADTGTENHRSKTIASH